MSVQPVRCCLSSTEDGVHQHVDFQPLQSGNDSNLISQLKSVRDETNAYLTALLTSAHLDKNPPKELEEEEEEEAEEEEKDANVNKKIKTS